MCDVESSHFVLGAFDIRLFKTVTILRIFFIKSVPRIASLVGLFRWFYQVKHASASFKLLVSSVNPRHVLRSRRWVIFVYYFIINYHWFGSVLGYQNMTFS